MHGLGGEELDLGIGVVRLHEAGGVDLHPLQVDGLRADLLAGTGSPMLRATGGKTGCSDCMVGLGGASPILMPSPVQCSPLVVGRCRRSGRYLASREFWVKSAPKPPAA